MSIFKILLIDLKKSIPAFLFFGSSVIYGFLIINNYIDGPKKATKYADMYYTWGLYGLLLVTLSIPISVTYTYYKNKKNEDFKEVELNKDKIVMEGNNKWFFGKYELPIYCKWIFILWTAYTIAWVMKLPYTNDFIYFLIVAIVGICWWRSKKTNDPKDIENSQNS